MGFRKKSKICLIVCFLLLFCLLFCGCTPAPLLSRREIVHAVFFQKQGNTNCVLLLLANNAQSPKGEDAAYRTVMGSGETPAQALEQAENSLDGQVFYGLLDLAVLPSECDWQQLQHLGRLLYERTKPAPQITLFLMDSTDKNLCETAPRLYRELEDAGMRAGISNGLQSIFSTPNECALPVWQGTGYGFVFLQKDRSNTVIDEPLAAQLAAVLCGQANFIKASFSQGEAVLQAQASVRHIVDKQNQNLLCLVLSDAKIADLLDEKRAGTQLQNIVCCELQRSFSEICSSIYTGDFDPFRTNVWTCSVRGIGAQSSVPQLSIHIEP